MPNDAYDDIPTQGTHQGDESNAEENETTVRGQDPPDPVAASGEKTERSFHLARHEESGRYRVRTSSDEPGEGYEAIGRHDTEGDLTEALGDLDDRTERRRFVVFENTDTGAVRFDREAALSDNWMADGRFDQFTLFESEDEAARYAEQRETDADGTSADGA